MKKISDVMQLIEKYEQAQVIMAANELEIIPLLEHEQSNSEELSLRLKVSERGIERLLLALKDLGLVKGSPASGSRIRYRPTRLGIECFGINGKIRNWTAHHKNLFRSWASLSESIRTDAPILKNTHDLNVASYAYGLMELYLLQYRKLQDVVNLRGKIKLLDVGGGLGHYTILAAIDNPSLNATIIDRTEIALLTRKVIKEYHLEQRISVIPGDLLLSKWPNDFNVALISNVLHGKSRNEARQLASKTFDALHRNGKIIINEWIKGSQMANLFDLNMLICTRDGHVWNKHQLRDLVLSVGFSRPRWRKFNTLNWILEAVKK
ncbi:MAG: methyltransferase [Nitrososphaera sp.]